MSLMLSMNNSPLFQILNNPTPNVMPIIPSFAGNSSNLRFVIFLKMHKFANFG